MNPDKWWTKDGLAAERPREEVKKHVKHPHPFFKGLRIKFAAIDDEHNLIFGALLPSGRPKLVEVR